ncbi:MSMEG_6728 family protein [Geodermatophilus sp. YIM 151500]|uniref:MSMEG_6728 family protein n=1 Tax=Geodermatophilus sp. YIM 151500 TaxID=2984531 RepID=UPI0021E49B12|nr:MSMEG_6728 family protein [Geodermatophilus sp. YIM 151500]MCV2489602.1 MSMEG_6728 family protein [Geodermatophilus sp. YIM 151500]
MQTFLPVADFAESARLLDSPRLGKQRVETLQVLRALELPDYGWVSHPVVRMWRGRTAALVVYGLEMVREWRARGFADTTDTLIAEFAPDVVGARQQDLAAAALLPSWVGDEALHRSHRSNLLAKDPDFYRPRFAERFGPEPDDLPYVWPEPDDVPPPSPPDGVRLWVVRPRAHAELGACLAAGVVGLGVQSGVDVDATGLSPGELRALSKELSGRRPAKDLRQLSAFLDEVKPGDPVALPVEHGSGLLLGEVAGDYLFQGRELLPHRRPARWDRVVPRSAARPPATLQDPRALFTVVVDPAVL